MAQHAGLDDSTARALTFSDEPVTEWGQKIVDFSRTGLGEWIAPFAKTGVRMGERGFREYSPFAFATEAGQQAFQNGGASRRMALAKAGLGSAAAAAGYAFDLDDPWSAAFAGPMALPMMAGGLLRDDEADQDWTTRAERAVQSMARYVPGAAPLSSVERYIGSFVPNAARDMAELLDEEEQRETPGFFGDATRKTPILRETLPPKR